MVYAPELSNCVSYTLHSDGPKIADEAGHFLAHSGRVSGIKVTAPAGTFVGIGDGASCASDSIYQRVMTQAPLRFSIFAL
jgi:hypothetical protein